jgi:hypothetical protein
MYIINPPLPIFLPISFFLSVSIIIFSSFFWLPSILSISFPAGSDCAWIYLSYAPPQNFREAWVVGGGMDSADLTESEEGNKGE